MYNNVPNIQRKDQGESVMHEMSMIRFTLDAVEQAAAKAGFSHVSDIRIVTGELRAAVPEQMQLAFRMLTHDQPMFTGACLIVQERPVRLRCADCGQEFMSSLETISEDRCDRCGSSRWEILSGRELYIESFAGESQQDMAGEGNAAASENRNTPGPSRPGEGTHAREY